MDFTDELMVKICRLHFLERLNYKQISEELKLSRYQVTRMIDKAMEKGIVKIEINEKYENSFSNLSTQIKKYFGLKSVFIVDSEKKDNCSLYKNLGIKAAKILEKTIKDKDIIAVSSGYTMASIAKSLRRMSFKVKGVRIIESYGSEYISSLSLSSHEISSMFAEKIGSNPYIINTPIIANSRVDRDMFLRQKSMKKIFEFYDKLNMILISISSLYPIINKSHLETSGLQKEDYEELIKINAVGAMNEYFFDIEGNFLKTHFYDRLISLPIEKVRMCKNTYCFVCTDTKKIALIGLLRTGIIKNLILDKYLAKEIIELSKCIKNNNDLKEIIVEDKEFYSRFNNQFD